MLFIDDYAAWSATSLSGAQEFARGYIQAGKPLKIVGSEQARHRTWVYDYTSSEWLERAASDAGGAAG